MAAWLIAVIDRLPPRARRMIVAATAVLVLAGAITALTLEAGRGGGGGRQRTAVASRRSRPASARPMQPPVTQPVPATGLPAARVIAKRFLVSFLQFAYGRGGAGSVKGVSPGLRRQLVTQRVLATPVERDRRPRVGSLAMVVTTPRFVVATATVEDRGVATYRLRFTLRDQAGRWLVSSVQEG